MRKSVIGVLVVVAVVLLLPVLFKAKTSPLVGPDQAELDYMVVSFRSGDLTLAGMVFLPEGHGPFPFAVVIHGSGTSRRNSPWYLTFAQHLQDNGVAVLLPDKRGSEQSEGDWRKSTFHDLAGDVTGAIRFIKDQTPSQYSNIGVIGFSQGGWIAPIVATENESVDFVVSISGAAVTSDEQLLYEEVNNIADFGTYRLIGQLIAPITVKSIKKTEFWKMIGGFDPIPYWRKVDVPAFMAYGENDRNVPVQESVRRIQALNKENITVKVYPNGGHGIIDPVTNRVQEECLDGVVDFIRTAGSLRHHNTADGVVVWRSR